jgi:multidrug efflux pump subunit AcrA (membrane-fusion protein)
MTKDGPIDGCGCGEKLPNGVSRIRAYENGASRLVLGCLMAMCVGFSAFAEQPKVDGQIGATGYITPGSGIVLMQGPANAAIRAIYVHVGDQVKKGDALIAFDDEAAKGEENIAVLDVDTATKVADRRTAIEDLTLRIAERKLQRAQKEAAAYRAVGAGGTSFKEVSQLAEDVEEARLAVEVQKVKQQQVQTEIGNAAKAAAVRLEIAKVKIAGYVLRAPSDGTILRIDRSPGNKTAAEPVLQFADLSTMFVVCQVYEGDMLKLKKGMKARITRTGIPDLGTGVVERVGQLIDGQSQLGEVRLRLDRNTPADRLVGMSVEVLIAP